MANPFIIFKVRIENILVANAFRESIEVFAVISRRQLFGGDQFPLLAAWEVDDPALRPYITPHDELDIYDALETYIAENEGVFLDWLERGSLTVVDLS